MCVEFYGVEIIGRLRRCPRVIAAKEPYALFVGFGSVGFGQQAIFLANGRWDDFVFS